MHLFVLMRGKKMDVEKTINDLNGKYLPFEHKTHGKGQLGVMCNPIVPCELIFPKEHLPLMIQTLGGSEALKGQKSLGYLQKYKKWIQKLLHLQPLPDVGSEVLKLPIHLESTEIIGIGIKYDKEFDDGTEYI
jgi:hypothetical protein